MNDSEHLLVTSLGARRAANDVIERALTPRRVATLEDLREHLQWAIELEHFTLPPYLCALYSVDPEKNPELTEILSSVLVEEMLHMTLAANLLNAIGGRPRMDTSTLLAGYPACLPHSDRSFEVPLMCFCPEALEVFLKIERPARPRAPAQGNRYETIGQFYDAIGADLRELSARLGEAQVFSGDPARQVTGAMFSGGSFAPIIDLASALAALSRIVEQGEGSDHREVWDGEKDMFHPERDEVAHYFRFQAVKLGRRYRRGDTPESGPTGDPLHVDWDGIAPMRANPRRADHPPGSRAHVAQREFDFAYCELLRLLDRVFDGSPQLLSRAIGSMYGLKTMARALMRLPTEDGRTTAGPTFEYVTPELRVQHANHSETSHA